MKKPASKSGAKTSRGVKRQDERSRKRAAAKSPADGRLGDALTTVDLACTLTSPLLQSVESLLRLAAQVIGSDEASVITRDENSDGLKFLVATGQFAEDLKKISIPPGKGIAGFVFTTGQPMAVSDVSREQSFYAEIDQTIGHSTQTILATPLRVREETIGVLEFVNRSGEPPYEPFSPAEMDRAAGFADTIALLVDAHEQSNLIESFLRYALAGAKGTEHLDLRGWIESARAAPEHRELLALAMLLRDVAERGDPERKLCLEMLTAISRWTQQPPSPSSRQDFFTF